MCLQYALSKIFVGYPLISFKIKLIFCKTEGEILGQPIYDSFAQVRFRSHFKALNAVFYYEG